MKRCSKCGIAKPRSEFYTGGYCKPCTKADVLRWARENPERFRQTQRRAVLKRLYGLAEADVDRMLAAQRHKCPICLTGLDKGNLNVDHDHATGRVRGLLCSPCNLSIGLLRDDPEIIRAAIRYLRQRKCAEVALF